MEILKIVGVNSPNDCNGFDIVINKAIELSYNNSILTFITSRYWLKSTGAKKLIAHINSELSFLQIIDVGNLKVFDNVVGNHMISLYKKCTTDNCLYKLVTEDITNIEKKDLQKNVLFQEITSSLVNQLILKMIQVLFF